MPSDGHQFVDVEQESLSLEICQFLGGAIGSLQSLKSRDVFFVLPIGLWVDVPVFADQLSQLLTVYLIDSAKAALGHICSRFQLLKGVCGQPGRIDFNLRCPGIRTAIRAGESDEGLALELDRKISYPFQHSLI
jgi:hypothetical protein